MYYVMQNMQIYDVILFIWSRAM